VGKSLPLQFDDASPNFPFNVSNIAWLPTGFPSPYRLAPEFFRFMMIFCIS